MYTIIWQYKIHPQHRDAFINHYNSDGTWVKFFQPSIEYFGTDFIELNDDEFITIDKWTSEEAYDQFLKENNTEYKKIDRTCEGFTVEEQLIGKYFVMEM